MTLWHDVRLAVRLLIKNPGYTAVAVLALGLGIGVNNTIFTCVNAVILRGLPYAEADRIMHLMVRNSAEGNNVAPVSYPDYEDWRTQQRSFQDLAALQQATMNVSDAERAPERTSGAFISANGFPILGQQPLLGRNFLPEEDTPGAEGVVIIGYGVWQSRYGGDQNILGQTIRVNEVPAKIVGVMPPGMKFPSNADMWQPLVPQGQLTRRTWRVVSVFGRLKPGVTLEQARADMSAIAARQATRYPDSNKGFIADVTGYNDRFTEGPVRMVFMALMAAVVFVLLIACANVANLQLARSAVRAREMALRMSVGATRWRIVRQLLVESIVLGCLAGLFGLGLSVVGVRLFDAALQDTGKPYWIQFTMDARVFAFFAAICVGTGILFGLAPALQVSRTNVNELLKEGGRTGGGAVRSRRASGVMVMLEVALTVVLLVGAGLMVRSFFKLYSMEFGFETRNLVGGSLMLAERKYPDADHRWRLQERLLERLQTVPGAGVVALTSTFPIGGGERPRLEVDGQPLTDRARAPRVITVAIAGDYFATLGVNMRRGRTFQPADGSPGAEVAIVNERFGTQFLQGQDPIGRRIRLLRDDGDSGWTTIVGLSPNIRQGNPQNVDPNAVVYIPMRQRPRQLVGILARTTIDPASVTPALRQAVRDIDPDQPLYDLQTMEQTLAQQRWPWRVFGTLFVVFACIALVLSAVGIYAVTAYSVAQRTQEIGVRIALGAHRTQVSWLILRRGLLQLGIGLAVGLVGAYFAGGVLRALLIQISGTDPATFVGITALLLVITVAACLLPARKAMKVDPVIALRTE